MKYLIVLFLLGYFLADYSLVVSETLPDIKTYSIHKTMDRWGGGQWTYLNDLIYRESNWKHTAKNPKSSAYGIGQFLTSTWKTVGCEKTDDPYRQIDCMLDYIELRYKTPESALKFHQKKNWY